MRFGIANFVRRGGQTLGIPVLLPFLPDWIQSGSPLTLNPWEGPMTPSKPPFTITKIGHVVLNSQNLDRSVKFYTEVLGFKVSDVYPTTMVPGGMVFMRYDFDQHGVALVGSMDAPSPNFELNHIAFEVATLDEVVLARNHLRRAGVPIDFEGRRRAGVQIAVEFRDPDGHRLEIFWGLDRVYEDDKIRPDREWSLALSLEDAIAH